MFCILLYFVYFIYGWGSHSLIIALLCICLFIYLFVQRWLTYAMRQTPQDAGERRPPWGALVVPPTSHVLMNFNVNVMTNFMMHHPRIKRWSIDIHICIYMYTYVYICINIWCNFVMMFLIFESIYKLRFCIFCINYILLRATQPN